MEVKIAIFHKGLLSTYEVRRKDEKTAYAFLKENKGSETPASFIRLALEGKTWISSYPDPELTRELVLALQLPASAPGI